MRTIFFIILVMACVFFCQSQGNKKIVVSVADSMCFRENMKFVREQKLTNLSKNNDSLYIRFTLTNQKTGNKVFYELKQTCNKRKARFIVIGKAEYENYFFQVVIFNKTYQYISNKTKKLKYKKQIKSIPDNFFESYLYYEMIDSSENTQFIFQKILEIKSISEIDTSVYKPEIDSSFDHNIEIEISTPMVYKYIYWPAYYYIDNTGLNFMNGIQDDLFELFYLSKRNYIFKNYCKNHWPKR